MKQSKAKLGFDALMFVGSTVIVLQFGKYLSDTLEDCCPTEEKILAELKAQQDAQMAMQQ